MRKLAAGWARMASAGRSAQEPREDMSIARMLALAFPERIGKARGAPGQFLLANGRGANLDATHPLARSPFLVAAELSGSAASTRILLAAAADEADILAAAGHRIREKDEIEFDQGAGALRSRRVRRLDAIVLANEPRAVMASEETARLLADGIAKLGLSRLPWSKAQIQLRDRVGFLRAAGEDEWPDLTDEALAKTAAEWLAPFLAGKTKLSEIGADDLGAALDALLPWNLKRRLEEEAPTHFEAPTGNRHAIDYETAGAPALHIRVQELFGLTQHPSIANGKLPLTLHLLSPAHRPIQITRDLPGFWKGSWTAVKAEMKGRYPRHPWPDDPASAADSARLFARDFALEQLAANADGVAIRDRHAAYFEALVERTYSRRWHHEKEGLDDLEREHDNLRSALDHRHTVDGRRMLRLAGALGWFWHVRSHYSEGRGRLAQALAAVTQPDPWRARALAAAGELAAWSGDLGTARPLIEEAVALWREQGHTQEIPFALIDLGWGCFYSGDPDARRLMEEGSAFATGNRRSAARQPRAHRASSGARGLGRARSRGTDGARGARRGGSHA